MKRLIIFSLFLFLFASCDLDSNGTDNDITLELLPIESVNIPESFSLGETYPITVSYFRPSTCHTFKEFYYLKNNNERTVAVIDFKAINNDCVDLSDELVEATFNFIVTSNGSYIFKFWQGVDENDEDLFLTIEVPVTN
ncbi:MAG: hypothetical protein GW839_10785 [Flavobacteriales bacterium]|nr:hypothetical protein [Flavobacteriia bacterium]NCP06068.1 hypothetical protein [Flavobacteriales bacterium]PIY11829.1 MAG: hypothetical protein COZ17_05735 [Flavobacteriaceae bacterium CG_4_10_14_3_um_filter_33_47]NCP53459.1 hypothetical protein [Flavobacteriales bacterium]NCP60768.1 hypothetical protein [Flavobacteriales bacterium]